MGPSKFIKNLIIFLAIFLSSNLLCATDANTTSTPLLKKFSTVAKTTACVLTLGAIAISYAMPRYIISPDEVELRSFSPSEKINYDRIKNLKIVRTPGQEIGSYVLGPMSVMMDLLNNRWHHRTVKGALKETIHDDFRYLAGYFLLYAGLRRMSKTFFKIDIDDFDSASGAKMKPDPKKVLYLSSFTPTDRLNSFVKFHFYERYRYHPDAQFIDFANLDDLISKLASLPQDNSYDRIEIFIHGGTNKLHAADGSKIKLKNLSRLASAKLNIAAPGADIKFISCGLAGGRPFDPRSSEKFIGEFGNAMLPLGGQVIGASRVISVVDSYAPPRLWSERKQAHTSALNYMMAAAVHIGGVGNFHYIWGDILFNSFRNYSASRKDAIAVQISARR